MSIIGRLFSSAQQVETSDLQNPDLWVGQALGGAGTLSGITVSPERALGLAAYYHCIRSISEDIAKLPLVTYRRLGKRGKEEDAEHPVHDLLLHRPSPHYTAFNFWRTITAWVLGWGNGFAEIEFSRVTGRPQQLWLIHPSRVEVRRLRGNHRRGIEYVVHNDDGTTVHMSSRRVLHLQGLGGDGLQGYSVWRLAMQSIGMGLATEAYGSTFFGNGAHLSGALRHPGKLGDKAYDHLRDSWTSMHGGLANAHKPAILEEGMEWQKIGIEPEAAQFLSTRTFNVEEMARWFRMPPSKMGVIVKAGAGGDKLTDEDVQALYVTDTLQSHMANFEQEVQRRLFPFDDEQDCFVRFQVVALLRGSIKARADFYSKLYHVGAMSANEIREAEDLNPIPNGDHYYVPVNLVEDDFASKGEAGGAPAPPDGPKTPRPRQPERDQTETDRRRQDGERRRQTGAPNRQRDRASALLPAFVDAFARVKARERNMALRGVKRHRDDDGAWARWLEEVRADHLAWIGTALEPLLTSACAICEVEEMDTPEAIRHAADSFVEILGELRHSEDLGTDWESRTDAREDELARSVLDEVTLCSTTS